MEHTAVVARLLLLADRKIADKLNSFAFIVDFQALRAYGQGFYSIYCKIKQHSM